MKLQKLFTSALRSPTARNVHWSLFGNGMYTVLTFVFFVLIAARTLGPDGFGRFSALVSFIILLAELTDMGIGPSLSRFIPPLLAQKKEQTAQKIIKSGFLFELVVSVALSIGVFLSAPFLSTYLFDGTPASLIRISAIGIGAITLFVFGVFVFSAYQEFQYTALMNTLLALGRVGVAVFLIFFGSFHISSAVVTFILPAFFVWGISFLFLKHNYLRVSVNLTHFLELFSFAKYIAVNKIASAIASRVDVLILIALVDAHASGIYSAAIRITQIYLLAAGSLSAVFAPKFSLYKTVHEAQKFTQKVFLIVMLFLVSVVLLFFIADPFIPILFGSEYIPAVPVFRALLVPISFFILQLPFTGLVVYTLKKPSVVAVAAIVQLIIIVVSNFYLVPYIAIYAPVVGLGLGYASALVILMFGTWYFRKGTTS